MFSQVFAQDEHLMSACTNMPSTSPKIIKEILSCNQLTDGLEVSMNKLNQRLSELRFLAPPAILSDLQDHSSMNSSAATILRQYDMGKKVEYSKPKLMYSFIKGCQAKLKKFTSLIVSLIVSFWFYLELQHKSPNEPLIPWLLKQLTSLVIH